ncbi:MAG: DUF4389 domain-containing protein [Halopseudomonas yangmingensis]|uniref:Lipase n=1 Tax=Halopseudomonas yangmingensis TaxID=1720063 RepID=A0A1I4QC34_9GAMM|nr:DUF4389 domain-containing protein [Halopseudomonas yangmingensis]SFM37628.1 protein of unknown function [Halopseudomonas yangmingensis]
MNPLRSLGSADFWIRLGWMLLFVLAWQVAEVLLLLTVLAQLFWRVLYAEDHPCLARWGQALGHYVRQIAAFLTSAEAVKPWPFVEWPGSCGQRSVRLPRPPAN